MTNTANSNQTTGNQILAYCKTYWGLSKKQTLKAMFQCEKDGDFEGLTTNTDISTYGDIVAIKAMNQ